MCVRERRGWREKGREGEDAGREEKRNEGGEEARGKGML